MSSGEKIEYESAMKIAKPYLYDLLLLDRTKKVAIVGSLRRKAEMIGDIDYQMQGSPSQVRSLFRGKGWIAEENGSFRQIFIYKYENIKIGMHLCKAPKINVFYTDYASWGAALMHNTGPARYNIRKRYLIKRKRWILNQYGLYKPDEDGRYDRAGYDREGSEDGYTLIASITEKDIYAALGWAYCKPEDRK